MSGQGITTARPRCFRFYQDMNICHSTAARDPKTECMQFIEDYIECMRHTKESERSQTIRNQASLNLAREGKSKAEVASLLKHGVGPAVGLMGTKGYEAYGQPNGGGTDGNQQQQQQQAIRA